MGRGAGGRKTNRERASYLGQTSRTDENGNPVMVSASARRPVSRQARNGLQQTMTPNGGRVRQGRNGSVTVEGGSDRRSVATRTARRVLGKENMQLAQDLAKQIRNGLARGSFGDEGMRAMDTLAKMASLVNPESVKGYNTNSQEGISEAFDNIQRILGVNLKNPNSSQSRIRRSQRRS